MTTLSKINWLIFALAMTIFAIMIFWSLPIVQAEANGLLALDLRPAGYSFDEVKSFLAALSTDGQAFYRDIQLRTLDSLYPALMALTLFLAIGQLAPIKLGIWRWALALIAVPGAIFDYIENSKIRFMLFLGPDNISPEIVSSASQASQLKSQSTTLAATILLGLFLVWLWKKFRRPQKV